MFCKYKMPLNRRIFYSYKYSLKYFNFLEVDASLNVSKRYTRLDKDKPEKIATAGTMQNVKDKFVQSMGLQRGYKPLGEDRSQLAQYLPKSQDELPPRTMDDSFASALIPLSNDLELQDKYIAFLGNVRLGRLLEDMDIFAAYVALQHISNPKLPEGVPTPYTLVTALVDRIDFTEFVPKPTEDIRLSGHVSWVGKSSIEVVVWLEQHSHGMWQKLTRALFLMAARDPAAEKSAVVNPLVATTDEEKQILSGGEERKRKRMLVQSQHVKKVIPNDEEQQIIHNLFLRTIHDDEISLNRRNLPEGCIWMESCRMSNLIFSHPENRNFHNTVFGGFIMRQALELSWALGCLFAKYKPTLKSISDINFNRPIAVNSFIRMHSFVVYASNQYFQITVYAESWNDITGKYTTTNTFHFTYEVPQVVKQVFPHSYQEAMMYVDGRRHFKNVMVPSQLKKDKRSK